MRNRTDDRPRRVAELGGDTTAGSVRIVAAAELGLDHLDGHVVEVVVETGAAGLTVGGGNLLQVVATTVDGARTISSGRLFLAGP